MAPNYFYKAKVLGRWHKPGKRSICTALKKRVLWSGSEKAWPRLSSATLGPASLKQNIVRCGSTESSRLLVLQYTHVSKKLKKACFCYDNAVFIK